MQCLNPIWLTETSERFGQYVPCGQCVNCLQKRRAIWTFRMMQENKDAESGYFITLTYDQENIPIIDQWGTSLGTLYKPDLTNFFKLLRTNIQKYAKVESRWFKTSEKTGKVSPRIRYFACGEYGSKGDRPHYHAIIWNIPDYFIDIDPIHNKLFSELIERSWKKGIVDVGEVTQQSCHYVAKYTLSKLTDKRVETDNREKAFATMSRNPGIGKNYVSEEIKKYYHNNKNAYARVEGGYKQSLGRYYKEKVYEDVPEIYREVIRNGINYAQETEEEMRKRYKENYEEYKREERKYSNRKISMLTKSNKL